MPSLQALADEGIKAVFTASQITQIVIAFVLLGVFPLAARWAMKLFAGSKSGALDSEAADAANEATAAKN